MPVRVFARRATIALGALMAAQSALGLLIPGAYRDVEWIRATWFGNDWVTLAAAVPLLMGGLHRARHGRPRGMLVWMGVLGYAIYNYAFYLFGAALNVFLPLYIAAFVLAIVTVTVALSDCDAAAIAAAFGPRTPVRAIGGYLVFVAAGLAAIWLIMWAAYVFAGRPTPIEPEAFKIVAALDLSLMVPMLGVGGVWLWRGRAWGFVVASIASVQGALYLWVLTVNTVVAIRRGLAEAPAELPIWGPLAVCTTIAAVVLLAHATRTPPSSTGALSPDPGTTRAAA